MRIALLIGPRDEAPRKAASEVATPAMGRANTAGGFFNINAGTGWLNGHDGLLSGDGLRPFLYEYIILRPTAPTPVQALISRLLVSS